MQPLGSGLARKATPTSGPTGHVQALALSHSKNRGPSCQHGPAAPARPLPRPCPARSRPLIFQEPPQKTIRQPGPAGLQQALSPTLHLPLPASVAATPALQFWAQAPSRPLVFVPLLQAALSLDPAGPEAGSVPSGPHASLFPGAPNSPGNAGGGSLPSHLGSRALPCPPPVLPVWGWPGTRCGPGGGRAGRGPLPSWAHSTPPSNPRIVLSRPHPTPAFFSAPGRPFPSPEPLLLLQVCPEGCTSSPGAHAAVMEAMEAPHVQP